MDKTKFSILVANYNNGHLFKDCYDSLIGQTFKEWEVIILDDCSSDNSVDVIKTIIGEDARFKFFFNDKNRGIGFTKRRLIDLATSDICGFVDPDDALVSDAVEKIINTYNNTLDLGMVYSNFFYCDENLNIIDIHKGKQISSLDESYYNFNGEISHFATFRRETYYKTGGIDKFLKIAEDKDLYMKMCEAGNVRYIDENLYLYRLHKGGISTNNNRDRAFFWHWVALIKMAERRNVNIEDLFLHFFTEKSKFDALKSSRWTKLGRKLGFLKFLRNE